MAEATVAVIIPSYNRPRRTTNALRSVLAQTRSADEIVVVDDGSDIDLGSELADEFPRVRVERQQHGGVSAARNHGVEVTSSEWLAFLDSDDEWHPDKLEKQLAAVVGTDYRIAHCDEIWIRNGRRVNPRDRHRKRGGFIYQHCLPLCCISPSAVILRRSLFDEVLGFDESYPACEDYDLWLRICFQYPVQYLDEALLTKYGGHPDQLSRSVEALDRYRARALENAWRLPLRPQDRVPTLETLIDKLEVLIQGAEKRELAVAEDYRRRRSHYRFMLGLEQDWQHLGGERP